MSDTSISDEQPVSTGCTTIFAGLVNKVRGYNNISNNNNNKNNNEETKALNIDKEIVYSTDN